MENASVCPTPMVTGKQVTAEGEPLKNPSFFRQEVGGLQYIVNTGPDIAYYVTKIVSIYGLSYRSRLARNKKDSKVLARN